jgi:poly(ADP-ribose) glycohydrolase
MYLYLLPIAAWALESEQLFVQPVPILQQNLRETVDLTRLQVRSLLALMFWCLMPKQNRQDLLPRDYTFARMYGPPKGRDSAQFNKLLCIINYFRRASAADYSFLSFQRSVLSGPVNWSAQTEVLMPLSLVDTPMNIEQFADCLMTDFADLSIGGGVLGTGCVQEEIMFLVHVEPIVAMLFTQLLTEHEALVVVGAQRFNEVTGYKRDFEWSRDFQDTARHDPRGRLDRHMVAIDAANYTGREAVQFTPRFVQRELDKAYVGFLGDSSEVGRRIVATGRWGCGAFCGDEQLKFLIQWCAASAARRPMHYVSWKPEALAGVGEVSELLTSKRVSEVVRVLLGLPSVPIPSVFGFVLRALNR